jgi:hypothetical protein
VKLLFELQLPYFSERRFLQELKDKSEQLRDASLREFILVTITNITRSSGDPAVWSGAARATLLPLANLVKLTTLAHTEIYPYITARPGDQFPFSDTQHGVMSGINSAARRSGLDSATNYYGFTFSHDIVHYVLHEQQWQSVPKANRAWKRFMFLYAPKSLPHWPNSVVYQTIRS